MYESTIALVTKEIQIKQIQKQSIIFPPARVFNIKKEHNTDKTDPTGILFIAKSLIA